MDIDSDLQATAKLAIGKFGGNIYSNGRETVIIEVLPGYLDGVDLNRCAEIAKTAILPIASIEDQFDSLLMLASNGDIYLCFIDGEELSVELYAKSLREAIAKALNVKSCLLWIYRKGKTFKRSTAL